jgi:hypothetical protein
MTEDEYRAAIASVRPDLVGASLVLHTEGWDSVAVEAGEAVFKFPRNEGAETRLRKEARLLALIRPRVALTVPDMRLHEKPVLFSEHPLIPGAMIETAQYGVLAERQRRAMAELLADFYIALHAIPVADAVRAGATPKPTWPPSADLKKRAEAALPPTILGWVDKLLAAYDALDNSDQIFGYFDGHGWNMAFDHQRGVLNGLYDFADAGIGSRAREFGYSSLISNDLTERLVDAYNRRSGKVVSLRDVAIHIAVQRVAELDAGTKDPAWFVAGVVGQHDYMQNRTDLRLG